MGVNNFNFPLKLAPPPQINYNVKLIRYRNSKPSNIRTFHWQQKGVNNSNSLLKMLRAITQQNTRAPSLCNLTNRQRHYTILKQYKRNRK